MYQATPGSAHQPAAPESSDASFATYIKQVRACEESVKSGFLPKGWQNICLSIEEKRWNRHPTLNTKLNIVHELRAIDSICRNHKGDSDDEARDLIFEHYRKVVGRIDFRFISSEASPTNWSAKQGLEDLGDAVRYLRLRCRRLRAVALSKVAAPDVETARAAHAAFESQLNWLLVAIDDRQDSKPQFTFSLYVGCLGEVLLWELGGTIPVMIWQHIWRQSWNIYKKEKEEYIEHLPLDERNPMAEFLRQLTHKIWIRPSNNALANRRIVIGLLIERCTLEALQTAIRERFIKHHQQFSLARFTAVSRRRSDRQTFLSA